MDLIEPAVHITEQGGVIGVLLVLVVASIILLWRYVGAPLTDSASAITRNITEITIANKDTAEMLRGMVEELRRYVPERSEAEPVQHGSRGPVVKKS
jgi:hypothetical protein